MVRRKQIFRYALLAAILVVLAGCSMSREYPQKHYYSLTVQRTGAAEAPKKGVVVKVRKARISPEFENRMFVYRLGGHRYESDFYNEFITSPALIFTDVTRKWFHDSGLFQNTVDFTSNVAATHTLELSLNSLYGDLTESGKSKAVLEIQAFLIGDETEPSRIFFHRKYHVEIPLAENSQDSLAAGWSEGMKQILAGLEKDLKAVDLK